MDVYLSTGKNNRQLFISFSRRDGRVLSGSSGGGALANEELRKRRAFWTYEDVQEYSNR